MKVLSIELNELSFDYLQHYIRKGEELPAFRAAIEKHGLSATTSENHYPKIEPWIQWVTAHTGMTFEQHGVFRLGDIVGKSCQQIWELLVYTHHKRIVAISPMNAENRVGKESLFLPDPWTNTTFSGSWDAELVYQAVKKAVNNNAHSTIGIVDALKLVIGMLPNLQFKLLTAVVESLPDAIRYGWARAIVLDLLLASLFVSKVRAVQPDFASLFLNAGAHIQHHYLFDSECYDGDLKNPAWYRSDKDPLLAVYQAYDVIMGLLQGRFPEYRIIVSTGLSQKPNAKIHYNYRPRDHRDLLSRLGVSLPAEAVSPRMSRDFLLTLATQPQAAVVERELAKFSIAGKALFRIENRGDSLFCQIAIHDEVPPGTQICAGDRPILDFRQHIAIVSIENGVHIPKGYLIDTVCGREMPQEMPLTALNDHIIRAVLS